MQTDLEKFDLEGVYDEQISPLMAQIIEICKAHNLPMVASFCYAVRPEEDTEGEAVPHNCTTYLAMPNRTPRGFTAAYHNIWNNGKVAPMTWAITTTKA